MENNMSLYKLDSTIKDVIDNGYSFNEETGEILFETEDLEKLEMSLSEKINNIVGYIKDLKLEEEMLSKVAKDYETRSKTKKTKREHLESYLDGYLQANKITGKREYTNGVISFRKSKSLQITSDVDLENYLKGSEEYCQYLKTEYKVDKTGLKKEVQGGKKIPFVELVEKNNLQIK